MSNSSRVTPYRQTSRSLAARQASTAQQATKNAAQIAAKMSHLSKRANQSAQNALHTKVKPLASTGLHARSLDGLIASAKKLGYRLMQLAHAVEYQPVHLFENAQGERLALEQDENGQVTAYAAGTLQPVHALVQQHALEATLTHLSRQGMDVQAHRLANGEIEIRARELTPHSDGAAQVTAQLSTEGDLSLDIGQIQGRRCDQIRDRLAEALGGEVVEVERKAAYFQPPHQAVPSQIAI